VCVWEKNWQDKPREKREVQNHCLGTEAGRTRRDKNSNRGETEPKKNSVGEGKNVVISHLQNNIGQEKKKLEREGGGGRENVEKQFLGIKEKKKKP